MIMSTRRVLYACALVEQRERMLSTARPVALQTTLPTSSVRCVTGRYRFRGSVELAAVLLVEL